MALAWRGGGTVEMVGFWWVAVADGAEVRMALAWQSGGTAELVSVSMPLSMSVSVSAEAAAAAAVEASMVAAAANERLQRPHLKLPKPLMLRRVLGSLGWDGCT